MALVPHIVRNETTQIPVEERECGTEQCRGSYTTVIDYIRDYSWGFLNKTGRLWQTDLPASYVVACAVILQVLDFRPLVTMTANSYIVFGLRPVTVWLSAVVSADWTHDTVKELRCLQNEKHTVKFCA